MAYLNLNTLRVSQFLIRLRNKFRAKAYVSSTLYELIRFENVLISARKDPGQPDRPQLREEVFLPDRQLFPNRGCWDPASNETDVGSTAKHLENQQSFYRSNIKHIKHHLNTSKHIKHANHKQTTELKQAGKLRKVLKSNDDDNLI